MDYVKTYKFQQGGTMPVEQPQANPEQEMMATIQQIIANNDCQGAMQLLSMMVQQPAAEGQAPVFKKGGKMKKMMGGSKMAQMKKNYMSK